MPIRKSLSESEQITAKDPFQNFFEDNLIMCLFTIAQNVIT